MIEQLTNLDLNVWHDGNTWRFTVYDVVNQALNSSSYMTLETTPERIARYFEVVPNQDEDWWVGNEHSDFAYILFGERN